MHPVLPTAVCCLALAGCGLGGGDSPKQTTTSQTTVPPASVPKPAGIEVTPPSGPTGTTFKISAKFQPQEKVSFEIDLPDGKTFKGGSHTAAADGTVDASYRTSQADPVGTFQVKAIGDHGDSNTGQFEVTSGGAPTTSRGKSGSTTTIRAATTTVRASTTTVRGQTTTSKRL